MSNLVQGIKCIEELDSEKFHHYLKTYGNTICGRHPIGVLLNVSMIGLHLFYFCLGAVPFIHMKYDIFSYILER